MLSYSRALESFLNKYSSSAAVKNYANAAGIGVVGGQIYVNVSGSPILLSQALANATTTTNVGAKNGATVTVVETGDSVFHTSTFTLTATPMTVADATTGGGVKIYDFPAGIITILGGTFSLTPTTTSALAGTLHGGVTLDIGVGTAAAGAGALTTTEDDIIDSVAGTSSATINVAGATSVGARTSSPASLDGHTTAIDANVNLGVPGAADIDADATVTITGTVVIHWMFGGDF